MDSTTLAQNQTLLRLAITSQTMLSDVRIVMSDASRWQVDVPHGIQNDAGVVEISAVPLRIDFPFADEYIKENVDTPGFGNSVMHQIAERAGSYIEDLFINGSDDMVRTNSDGSYVTMDACMDGWLKRADGGENVLDASGYDDYETLLSDMLNAVSESYTQKICSNYGFMCRLSLTYSLGNIWQ